jgi:hypothetical protein
LTLFFLILLAGSPAAGDEFGRDGVLEIFIRSDKPIYKFGEPIKLTLTLKNHTTEPLIVNKRFDLSRDLRWEVFMDGHGFLTVKPTAAQAPTGDDYVILKPNLEIEKSLPPLSEIVQEKLKRGLYGVRVTYVNREKPKGAETWTGEIVTNRISFQIKSGEKV